MERRGEERQTVHIKEKPIPLSLTSLLFAYVSWFPFFFFFLLFFFLNITLFFNITCSEPSHIFWTSAKFLTNDFPLPSNLTRKLKLGMVSFIDLSGFNPSSGAVGSHSAASRSWLQFSRVNLWKEHENSRNKSPASVWESNQRPSCWGATVPTNRLPCYPHGLSASHPVLLSGEGGIEDTGRLSRVSFRFVWTTWTSQETHTHTRTQSGRNRPAGVCLCVCLCELWDMQSYSCYSQ